ncbi:hypothetical protein [Oscillospiraceae bacterium]|nr:hypothetical protein [Oscillospiraceae bacterium]
MGIPPSFVAKAQKIGQNTQFLCAKRLVFQTFSILIIT